MADTFLQFNAPAASSTVGETFTVSGTNGVLGPHTIVTYGKVTVTFGNGGQAVTATPNSAWDWTCSGSVAPNALSGQTNNITVSAEPGEVKSSRLPISKTDPAGDASSRSA